MMGRGRRLNCLVFLENFRGLDNYHLDATIDKLVIDGELDRAEAILLREYAKAKSIDDKLVVDAILCRLIFVYAAGNPANVIKGEECCLAREKNLQTAYNMLQTGMFLNYTARNYEGTVAKLHEAIAKGKQEGDS